MENTDFLFTQLLIPIIMLLVNGYFAVFITERAKEKHAEALATQIKDLENRNAIKLEELKKANAEQLQIQLKDLESKKEERDARREYEYEARKKLYEQYEPLFFRFAESTENAYFRIISLANRCSEGRLDKGGWLDHDGYYLQSTIYFLTAPFSNYKLLSSKLTYVDLRLDKGIYSTYILGKVLFLSFSDAFRIAETMNEEYSPYEGKMHPRQDLPIGITENVAELLIETDISTGGSKKVMNLGAFQSNVLTKVAKGSDLEFFIGLIRKFHPQNKPVLWKVLIVQSLIYDVIDNIRKDQDVLTKEALLAQVVKSANNMDISQFNWWKKSEKAIITEKEMRDLFQMASIYVHEAINAHY